MPSDQTFSFFEDVYAVVRLVPRGRVTTYGAIAHYLGSRGSARMVGWAMNQAHSQSVPRTDVPRTDVPRTDVPRTDVPRTDVPRTDVPRTDVPRTDVPRTDVPRTDVPRTDVPRTDVPRTDVPRTDVPRTDVPAQRVVNRVGLLTGKHHFGAPDRMQQLLEAEGVTIKDDRVQDFEKLFWDPSVELI